MILQSILIAVLIIIGVSPLLGKIFPKTIGHNVFGWHVCKDIGFDGCSLTGTCIYCGEKFLMDSQ